MEEINVPTIEWARKTSIETKEHSHNEWYNNIMGSIVDSIKKSSNNGLSYAIVVIYDRQHIIKVPREVMKKIKKDLRKEKYKVYSFKRLNGSVNIKIKW